MAPDWCHFLSLVFEITLPMMNFVFIYISDSRIRIMKLIQFVKQNLRHSEVIDQTKQL